jgi:hypothetical protein
LSTTVTPRYDRTSLAPPDVQSSSVIGWLALACSVGWVAGFGSLAGVVLGTWSIVRARRRGLRAPIPAVIAIVIGTVVLVLSLAGMWVLLNMEVSTEVSTGSGPAG